MRTGSNIDATSKIEQLKGAKMVRSFCYTCPFQCPSEVCVKILTKM